NCPSCSAPSALNLPEIWESSSIQWTSAPPKEPDFPATILFRWSNGEISAISSTSTTTSTSTSSQLRRFTLNTYIDEHSTGRSCKGYGACRGLRRPDPFATL